MIILKITLQVSFGLSFISIFDTFYLKGEPISPYLLRYKGFAVEYYSFILKASHLQQSQLVNNPG